MATETQPLSRLSTFFQGSETRFGIFYPQNYVVAVFPDYETARQAEAKMRHWGATEKEVIAVPGSDVVEWTEENLVKSGMWSVLMRELSKMFATEEIYHESDLEHAKRGAGFLAAHAPDDKTKRDTWKIIREFQPIAARHYSAGGVHHLFGENLP